MTHSAERPLNVLFVRVPPWLSIENPHPERRIVTGPSTSGFQWPSWRLTATVFTFVTSKPAGRPSETQLTLLSAFGRTSLY